MNGRDVAVGLGLAAYGCAFFGGAWWYVGDDARLRRLAQQRWRFDRRMEPRVRRGEITREEWFDRWSRSQRLLVRRVFPVFFAIWLVLTLGTAIHGLLTSG